jgi:hypothetical protein
MPRPRKGSDLSISELENILHQRRASLTKLERERAKLVKKLDELDAEISGLGGSARGGRGGRVKNAKSLTQTMIEVLSDKNGGPMKVADIVDAVLAKGYKTNSDNFRGIVNQTLIKEKQFVSSSRGAYQLKKSAMEKS